MGRRVTTAREQVQMLSPWRKLAFTQDSDWTTDQYGGRECRLENGHILYCTQVKSRPEVGWQWAIYDNNQEAPEKRGYAVMQGGKNWGGFDDPKARLGEHLPTFEHARSQVEQEYQKLYPLGTNVEKRDSGVDYDAILNRRDEPDEDYGHIFGRRASVGRVAARPSDLHCRDCGATAPGGFGYDEDQDDSRYECPGCGGRMDYDVRGFPTAELVREHEASDPDTGYGWALLEELHERAATKDDVVAAGQVLNDPDVFDWGNEDDDPADVLRDTLKNGPRAPRGYNPHWTYDTGRRDLFDPPVVRDPFDMDAPQADPDEHLDPDDPRIKGAARTAQMSWDEVMRRIDEQLAEGEPEPTEAPSTGVRALPGWTHVGDPDGNNWFLDHPSGLTGHVEDPDPGGRASWWVYHSPTEPPVAHGGGEGMAPVDAMHAVHQWIDSNPTGRMDPSRCHHGFSRTTTHCDHCGTPIEDIDDDDEDYGDRGGRCDHCGAASTTDDDGYCENCGESFVDGDGDDAYRGGR